MVYQNVDKSYYKKKKYQLGKYLNNIILENLVL